MGARERLLGEWVDAPGYRHAYELWMRYYARTEAFDQARCEHRLDGVAIPISAWERQQCSRNAAREHSILRRELDFCGISSEVSADAQRAALRDFKP